jgi:hypothetical protein
MPLPWARPPGRRGSSGLGCPKVLADERLGHGDGSVSARYTHVTELQERAAER